MRAATAAAGAAAPRALPRAPPLVAPARPMRLLPTPAMAAHALATALTPRGGNGRPIVAARAAAPDAPPSTALVKYLYDGDCPMCRTLKNVLTRQDGDRGRVEFVNIADLSYDPAANGGVEYEDAMDTIHVIEAGGDVVTGKGEEAGGESCVLILFMSPHTTPPSPPPGPDALRLLYDTVGLGWASRLAAIPVISSIVDALYELISKYRLGIGGVDAIIAMKRLAQAEAGEDQCDKEKEEGCDAPEW